MIIPICKLQKKVDTSGLFPRNNQGVKLAYFSLFQKSCQRFNFLSAYLRINEAQNAFKYYRTRKRPLLVVLELINHHTFECRVSHHRNNKHKKNVTLQFILSILLAWWISFESFKIILKTQLIITLKLCWVIADK